MMKLWVLSLCGVAVLGGFCPKKPPYPPPEACPAIANDCECDEDCRGDRKCCTDNGCFYYCARPVSGKPRPGLCPNILIASFCLEPFDQCDIDNHCPRNQKCCQGPCGRICAHILRPVPGTCPPPSGDFSTCDFNPARGDCLKDIDCASRGQLCCPEGCGKRCKYPVADPAPVPLNGRCPPVNKDIRCFAYINQCGPNKKCARGLICCPGQCGRECEKPITVRPGTCPKPPNPAVVSCAIPITDRCSSDTDCPSPEKCCPHPCGRFCQNPFKSGGLPGHYLT